MIQNNIFLDLYLAKFLDISTKRSFRIISGFTSKSFELLSKGCFKFH